MISLSCDHPDIEDFINIKTDLSMVNKANISIRVTDEFLDCVENNKEFTLRFSNDKCNMNRIINANELFDKFAKVNWDYAEPGCLFWDRITDYNFLDHVPEYRISSTNPCGEQPLCESSACCLGSMNLSEYVVSYLYNYETNERRYRFDMETFEHDVYHCVYALNDVLIDGISRHPLPEQRKTVGELRQIGLGIMGLGDMLIKLGIKYGSNDAIVLCEDIARSMINTAVIASVDYKNSENAKNTGMDKPHIHYNAKTFLDSLFVKTAINESTKKYVIEHGGMFNSQLLTCAPTGTLSTMLNISGGIEPIFATHYVRKTESLEGKDVYYKVFTGIAKKYVEEHNLPEDAELPDYFVTAHDLDYHQRIDMQSVWQTYIDASISSTVNLPNSATVEDVKNLYLYAWNKGLKGVTIFRDGCARLPVLSTEPKKKETKQENEEPKRGDVVTRHELFGLKRTIQSGCVDYETEFFNGHRWKRICDYTEDDMVLQYCEDGHAELVKPLEYIKRKTDVLYRIYSKYGIDMVVSPDHRNVVFKRNYKTNTAELLIKSTNEIIDLNSQYVNGFPYSFLSSFTYDGKGINLKIPEIRLCVAIFADGCFHYDKPHLSRCHMSLFKERKKQRLRLLLDLCGYEYNETFIERTGYSNFYFKSPLGTQEKHFPKEWYNCNKEQLEAIFDEVFQWDGYEKKHNQYSTNVKENADFIQFVCTALGKRSTINIDDRRFKNGIKKHRNITYRVDWNNRIFMSIQDDNKNHITRYYNHDGYDYCFRVPTGMLVLRRNNRIFITGNCGRLHVAAYFDRHTGDFVELFLGKGSKGGCLSTLNGLARMVSLSARGGVPMKDIVEQLKSANVCPAYAVRTAVHKDTSKGSCCPSAIANALLDMENEMKSYLASVKHAFDSNPNIGTCATVSNVKLYTHELSEDKIKEIITSDNAERCPECGEPMERTCGCVSCPSCGWSKCG